MWHYIRANASTNGLGRIVSIACDFGHVGPSPFGGPVAFHAREIAARVVTLRDGQATRKSQFTFERWSQLWAWVHKIGNSGNPITLVVDRGNLTVPAIGVFEQIDCGALRLSWKGTQRKRADGTASEQRKCNGIVCLTGPPIIITGRLCSGSIVRVLDVANFGILDRDLWAIYRSQFGDDAEPTATTLEQAGHDHHYRAQAIEMAVLWLIATCKERNLGMFRFTAASQASAAWRHGRMGAKVVIHDEQPVQDLESAGYYGGRIDLWYGKPIKAVRTLLPDEPHVPPWGPIHKPTGPIYGVDVNGLFGSVMRDCLFPCRLADWRIMGEDTWTGRLDEPAASIARVVVETAGEEYPVRVSGETVYARGCYVTTLAGPELAQAVARGRILRIGSWARYDLADLFSGAIEEWWGYRLAAKGGTAEFERRFWKRLINSLYGKLAQRRKGWAAASEIQAPGPWQTWYTVDQHGKPLDAFRSIGRHVQRMEDQGPGKESFVAIAAFVTANARLVMDRLRDLIGKGHYYYQAIDSLYVDTYGYNRLMLANLVDQQKLGMVKREGCWPSAHFKGLGHYIVGGEETAAGRNGNAVVDKLGRWTELEIPGLDVQVANRPLTETLCRTTTGNWTRIQVPGRMNGTGWVSPPELGLHGDR